MKKLLTIALAGLMTLGLTGCGSNADEEGTSLKGKTLKVVTAAPYAPYETMNEKGELEGFDIDLANALAETLGFTIEWQNLEFDAALLAIQSGQADFAIAGLSPDETRKSVMDFTEVYYQDEEDTANTIVTLKEKGYQSIDDLKGKIVGVQNGTIQHTSVEGIADEYELKIETRKDYADIAQEILNGKIDFMICEDAMAKGLMETYDVFESFLLTVGEVSEGNAIAVKKGSALKATFDAEIKKMKENGEMQKLIEKWFTKDTAEK